MKTLLFCSVILTISSLVFLPYPLSASDQDTDVQSRNTRAQVEHAGEETNAKTGKTLQDIRASVQQFQRENQVRIQQLTEKIEALSEQTKQQALSVERQTREGIPAATDRKIPEKADPYDSEEAQRKAEAALLRTGSTGPKIIAVIPSFSEVVPVITEVQGMESNLSIKKGTVTVGITPVEQALADLDARVTPTAIVVSLRDSVLFDFDRAAIKKQAAATLGRVATIIRKKGTGTVLIEGHTDSKGSEAYNQRLSEKRADAVRIWLIRQGNIDAKRLQTRGYGESRPVAPNTRKDGSDNPEGRALNRRVVIRISTGQS